MLHFALTFFSPVDFIGFIMIYQTLQVSCRLKTHRSLAFELLKYAHMSAGVCDGWLLSINVKLCKAHKLPAQQDLRECERSRAGSIRTSTPIIILSILNSGLRS